MKSVLGDVVAWSAEGRQVATARVVGVEGSGPRELGATMSVNDEGVVSGSVSGGCVEGAVVTEALAMLAGNRVPRLVTYGIADEEAFAVGLTCGGTIHVFIEPADASIDAALLDSLDTGEPAVMATVIEGSHPGATMLIRPGVDPMGSLGDAELDRVVARDAVGELEANWTGMRNYGPCGEARRTDVMVFLQSFAAPPRMVICGAVDFTAALAKAAKLLGYRVSVCDARATFATAQRFPMADELVVDWPDRCIAGMEVPLGPRDAICVLTHDPKFDVPAIVASLATDVGYLGAMGSRRTHADRTERLRAAGVGDDALARVMGPIGIDIGARTPEETAISIVAEIIALRTGKAAAHLRDTTGPIHR